MEWVDVPMDLLNRSVAYWYDCIRSEDILEKDISVSVRKKAVLYPFDRDHFVFDRKGHPVSVSGNEKLQGFFLYATAKGYEPYYGYPVLFYFDDNSKRYMIAPLFIIKVNFVQKGGGLYLEKEEQHAACGLQAFERLGFRTEGIADVSQSIEKLFRTTVFDAEMLAKKCLEVIQKEGPLPVNEHLNPTRLTNSKRLSKNMTPGLYNKSLVFAGENTVYNINLLRDLLELKRRRDFHKTSLSYLLETLPPAKGAERTPILPFPANEYQIEALKGIFENTLSVITGPPGTGKSQYIANLLVNLFLDGKSVLFVSHTNEAVSVVNERLNLEFRNLMLRTGSKKFRQELKEKFNELVLDSERTKHVGSKVKNIHSLWKAIAAGRRQLTELDRLQERFEAHHQIYQHQKKFPSISNLFSRIGQSIKNLLLSTKLKILKGKLNRLPDRLEIEQEIRRLEDEFYTSCRSFVRGVYMKKMLGKGRNVGRVKSFLHQVHSSRLNENLIDSGSFTKALNVLRVWSSTLKSIRGTFPLKAGIFDFVIFDEASQVDLPSAAPALYRAKKAIVVGDPMQLTHIASITKEIDKELAQDHGLTKEKGFYHSKIRYCDVSLYKSAENSLNHKPILLINHYRSEDQIIGLCNETFYGGRLKIMSTLNYSQYPSSLPLGIQWVDCKGEVFKHPAGSRINQREADLVTQVLGEVLHKIRGTNLSVGVVTPYSRQQDAIYERVVSSNSAEALEKHAVRVLTAHKFQGSEKDIVIFSLVLSKRGNANSDRWYNIYPQILNVALSRARFLLYIVGDKEFCHSREGVLGRLAEKYNSIKKRETMEKSVLSEEFDSPTERFLFRKLQEIDFKSSGYTLIPKLVVKRYTLDFALTGKKNINIECDGCQHELIDGLPVLEDVERDSFLQKEGWEVLRFPNHTILSEPNKVIEDILNRMKSA